MPDLRRACVLIALSFAAHAAVAAQPPALRIVVIEGEDAVNIIQQKTAVAPLVEVRDRNNLPVPGVAVTFTVGGQGASFGGGLSTLTVTTNAAGQAAAVGLTPTAAGAVQINAAAVFQGQTAVATITQTNVLTAAQAATAAGATSGASGGAGGGSGASAGGAAGAGGGGGLSATTVGIVGAAVGGGALVATQVGGSEEPADTRSIYSGAFSGTMVLTFPGCTRPETYTGTLKIALEPGQAGVVSGTATIEGGRMVVGAASTCPNGPQPGTTGTMGMPPAAVSGAGGAVTFNSREVVSVPPSATDPRGGVVTNELIFTGNMSGDVITGTLAHALKIESPGSGIAPGTGSTTYAVTLR